MDEHGTAVLRLARAYLGDAALAEDVFQDVFVQAFRSASGLRDARAVRAWLLTVTANRCRDHLRSWTRRKVSFAGEVPEAVVAPETEDQDRQLVEAVLALPVAFREVVLLRYYEELSVAEIASVLAVPPVTVRTRLHRARKALRRSLREVSVRD
jgi:RNA polymerase sigma-70 factor (ECF subfamily)